MIENRTRVLINMDTSTGSKLVELLNSLGGEVLCSFPIGHIKSLGYLIAYDEKHNGTIGLVAEKHYHNTKDHLPIVAENSMLDRPNDNRYYCLALPNEVRKA